MAQMIVNGKPTAAASGATMEVRNPATGELVDSVPRADAEDTRRAIEAAHAAFKTWSYTSPAVAAASGSSEAAPVSN